MNIYNDDNGNDANDILTGKLWLKRLQKPKPESKTPVNLNLDKMPRLLAPTIR